MLRPSTLALALLLVGTLGCDSPTQPWQPPYTSGENGALRLLYTSHVPVGAVSSCSVQGGCDVARGLILQLQTQYPEARVALEATPVRSGAPFVGRVDVPVAGTLRLRSTSCADLEATTQLCESETSCTVSAACTGYPLYVDVEGLVEGTHELLFRTSSGDEVDRIGLPVLALQSFYDGGT